MIAILERDFLSFARTKKFFVMRSAVVVLPLIAATCLAVDSSHQSQDRIGQAIFWATAVVECVIYFLIAPGMFSSILAEEKNNRKLDVLRTTPLSIFRIVLGKWLARLGLMTTIWLAGLPMLAGALIYGGVTPKHFLDAAMVLYATILWTSAIALVVSAANRDVGRAARTTYAAVIGWALIHSGMGGLVFAGAMPTGFLTSGRLGNLVSYCLTYLSPVGVWAAVGSGMWSNPFRRSMLLSPDGAPLLSLVLTSLASIGSLSLAARLLAKDEESKAKKRRRSAANETGEESGEFVAPSATTAAALALTFERAPAELWRRPLMWLETRFVEKKAPLWRRAGGAILLAVLEVFWWVAYLTDLSAPRPWTSRGQFIGYHIGAISVLGVMSLIRIIAGGASVVHRDGEARTEDVLFSTPAESRAMFFAKVASVFRPLRFIFVLIAVHCAVLVFEDSDQWLGALLCFAALAMVSLFFAAVSMRMALRAPSMRRALVRAFAFAIVFLLIYPAAVILMFILGDPSSAAPAFLLLGYHPAFLVISPLALADMPIERVVDEEGIFFVPMHVIGYLIWTYRAYSSTLPDRFAQRRENVGSE